MIDHNKNYRIINSFLSKLTLQEIGDEEIFYSFEIDKMLKEHSKLEKLMLPIKNQKGLMHYIRLIRYSHNENNQHILQAPDCFMQTRKGNKFEHAIFLACLMMNFYSKLSLPDNVEYEEELMLKVNEELAKFQHSKNNNILPIILNKVDEQKGNNKVSEKDELLLTKNNNDPSKLDISTNRTVDQLIKSEDKSKVEAMSEIEKHKQKLTEKFKNEILLKKKKKTEIRFDSVK